MRFAVMDRADAEGPRPRRQWPSGWYSGADAEPVTLVPRTRTRPAVRSARSSPACSSGHDTGIDEISTLFSPAVPRWRPSPRWPTSSAVTVGDTVTFVVNRNINYTNVCTFKCRFCAFSKGPLSLNLRGTPYLLELDEIAERVVEAGDRGATEVCLQGGIHPDFDGDYYLDVIEAVREAVARRSTSTVSPPSR